MDDIWKGTMTIGDLDIYDRIYYQVQGPSEPGVRAWRGEVINASNEVFVWAAKTSELSKAIETSIGNILLTNISLTKTGSNQLVFTGTGTPAGLLADAMGLEECAPPARSLSR